MRSLLEIKKERQSADELSQLIEILKAVTIAQFHTLTRQRERFKKFFSFLDSFFQIANLAGINPCFKKTGPLRQGIIIITSDMGFMSGLNRECLETGLAKEKNEEAQLIVLGQKGASYLRDLKKQFIFFPGITLREKYEQARKLKDYLINSLKEANLSRLSFIYPQPITFMHHKIVVEELNYEELFKEGNGEKPKFIVESSPFEIIEYLLATQITCKLYEIFEDAKISELTARIIHLERCCQKLEERNKKLKGEYFKGFHYFVDKNIRLITLKSRSRR